MSGLTSLPTWKALTGHQAVMADMHMRKLFRNDPRRFDKFSLYFQDVLLDFSKNLISDETMALLRDLAKQVDVKAWTGRMFSGEHINSTENRAVLHVALRNRTNQPIYVDGEDVMPLVNTELAHMREFVESVHNGNWKGYSGKTITEIVNIGIGGSYLGPAMVAEALTPYHIAGIGLHFMSNVDGSHVQQILNALNPETTLFIVVSKSFITLETLTNAHTARQWLLTTANNESAVKKHFVAVSANEKLVQDFGINPNNMFKLWDWVGGRFSLWSAAGLSIALVIGVDRFEELLTGAHEMDEHFRQTPIEENIPITLALIGIWYINFFGAGTHAVLPYDQNLSGLPAYLQQCDMESNGKHVTRDGQAIDYATAPVIFGESGTNGQHSFYQMLHAGTHLVPADFLVAAEAHNDLGNHHRILFANFIAQTEALMQGKTEVKVRAEMEAEGCDKDQIDALLPHKVFPGNHPTNSFLYRKLTPHTLGAIIAMYEHKIFVQSIIWNINPFDQWGVELGKQLADTLLPRLGEPGLINDQDASTNGLVNYYKSLLSDKGDGSDWRTGRMVKSKELP